MTLEDAVKLIADLRKENAAARNKEKAAETAAAAAETERLKKQGEFQTLAEKREAELNTVKPQLETLQGRYDALSTLLSQQLETEIKDWPVEIKAFDPGKDAPVEARMEWVSKSRALVEKLVGAPARPGNRPGPAASGPAGTDIKAELRSTGNYQRF
jgi:hypothetical protein